MAKWFSTKRKGYYFGAGPAMLPEAVLQEAQRDLLNWQNTGLSVLEIGHRTVEFRALLDEAESRLRRLLKIPKNYHVLFLSGPARLLFSMIPLNFLGDGETADYLVTGLWSELALQEAQKLKSARAVEVGDIENARPTKGAAKPRYFYYTPNETVNGIYTPKPYLAKSVPLVADMTSCLLAEPLVVEDYALIFAGAQKNIANAGLTLVILRDEFLKEIQSERVPSTLHFQTQVTHRSLYHTPATFNCYLAYLMFAWVEAQGGVEALSVINQQKSALLYDYLDKSAFYTCSVEKSKRSPYNVCFQTPSTAIDAAFLEEANRQHFQGLAGHRVVGGLRASLYNAMPLAGVERLIEFMQAFSVGYLK